MSVKPERPEQPGGEVLDALRDPACLLAPDGVVRYANAAWEASARRPGAPPVVTTPRGGSLPTRCRTAHLSGFASGPVIAQAVEDVAHGVRDEYDAEYAWETKGGPRWFLVTATRVRDGGAVVVHKEITQQKLAQQSLSQAWDFYLRSFDDFPALVWRTGPDGRATWFNRTWLQFTSRTLAQEVGEGYLTSVPADARDVVQSNLREAMSAKANVHVELPLRRADGDVRTLVVTGHPFDDEDGHPAGYLFSAIDITSVRRAEAEAQRARAAERAAEARALNMRSELMDTELGELHHMTERARAPRPLFDSHPDVFAGLIRRYAELLDLALERRAFAGAASPSEGLRELAGRLALLDAGPRDVVELHARALREATHDVPVARRSALHAEGRLLALELMGHLVNAYRQQIPGASPASIDELKRSWQD